MKFWHKKTIYQLTIGYKSGDAITEYARNIRNYLNSQGALVLNRSYYIDPKLEKSKEIKKFHPKEIPKNSSIIFHFSMSSELTPFIRNHKGRKVLVYHNITPSYFFEKFDPRLHTLCKQGRKELLLLKNSFDFAFCDSEYNAKELQEIGFPNVEVIPIIFPQTLWQIQPDINTLEKFHDGRKNILFVGRIVPNKKQEDLIYLFKEMLEWNSNLRLILVGHYETSEIYYLYLQKIVKKLKLEEQVVFTGSISQNELKSVYQIADLFCSMSEHEGFCVPLIEAMWHDIPILAYKSTAVPETLGNSGILFTTKKELKHLAALALLILEDLSIREKIVSSQQERREYFLLRNQIQNYQKFLRI